jgi:hypothetical protein
VASAAIVTVGLAAFVFAIRALRRSDGRALAPSPVVTEWQPGRAVALGAGLIALVSLLLWAVIPEPVVPESAPTEAALRVRVTERIPIPSSGEAATELKPGAVVLLEMPANRLEISDVLVALDDAGDTLWLCYGGEVSGKTAGKGVVEQIRSGDPTALVVQLDAASPTAVRTARFTLVQDQTALSSWMARAAAETGWATRGF